MRRLRIAMWSVALTASLVTPVARAAPLCEAVSVLTEALLFPGSAAGWGTRDGAVFHPPLGALPDGVSKRTDCSVTPLDEWTCTFRIPGEVKQADFVRAGGQLQAALRQCVARVVERLRSRPGHVGRLQFAVHSNSPDQACLLGQDRCPDPAVASAKAGHPEAPGAVLELGFSVLGDFDLSGHQLRISGAVEVGDAIRRLLLRR